MFYFVVNESSGQREVAMLQPFTRKDLVIRSLPDRLNDCPQMLYLYPDIPKVIVSLYLRSLSITLNVYRLFYKFSSFTMFLRNCI